MLGRWEAIIGIKVGGEPEVKKSEDYGFVIVPANPTDLAEKY